MSHFLNNPDLYDQPIRLTEEERLNPLKVFKSFFQDYDMSDLRHYLWDIVECCLTVDDECIFQDASARSNLISLYGRIEEFFEAGLIIYTNGKKEGKP